MASAAWRSGNVEAARENLWAWSRSETDVRLSRAATALAAAVADLDGTPMQWGGPAALVELEARREGGWVVPIRIGGVDGRLLLDLAARQSSISPAFANAAGLLERTVDLTSAGAPGQPPQDAGRHELHSSQAACPALQIGSVTLANAILGVSGPPDGVDGVLGFDLLSTARWSLRLDGPVMALGPAAASAEVQRLVGGSIAATVAWLNPRIRLD